MQKRMTRWLTGGMLALALAFGLVTGGGHPTVAHGGGPTPTPTVSTNSEPGGGGGSGG